MCSYAQGGHLHFCSCLNQHQEPLMSSDWHQVWIALLFFNYLLLLFFFAVFDKQHLCSFFPFFKATAPPLLDPVSLSGRDHSNLSALTWLTQVAGCLLSFCLSHTLKIQDLNPLLCCCLAEFLWCRSWRQRFVCGPLRLIYLFIQLYAWIWL